MSRNGYTLGSFAKFCRELVDESGKRMKLQSFQREVLADHFAGATELVSVMPKKNGKTTLIAALALFHLDRWPEADCVIGASSRDQARILFRQAAGLVRRSGLGGRFDVRSGYGLIRLQGLRDGPRIQVMAADAKTGDGVIPTLALVDELHRHPSGDLYGVFRDGLGPRGGRMVTISTAGARADSPLGHLRETARALPSFTRDPETKHSYARSENGSFVLHEWSLDPSEDVDDIGLVKLANPAPWHTVRRLQQRHDSPTMTPWQWRRFACGIWTEGEEPWIDPQAWDRLADPGLELEPGEEVWLGVDVGVRKDSTGIAIVAQRDERLAVVARILNPPVRGTLALEVVEDEIRDLCRAYTVKGVVFDPWSFRRSAELLEADGIRMVEWPQSPEKMAACSATLYRLINAGELCHDGDPVLRAQVMAGVVKETERGWRLHKDPKKRPIDALIALAMAAQIANDLKPSVYEQREVVAV